MGKRGGEIVEKITYMYMMYINVLHRKERVEKNGQTHFGSSVHFMEVMGLLVSYQKLHKNKFELLKLAGFSVFSSFRQGEQE